MSRSTCRPSTSSPTPPAARRCHRHARRSTAIASRPGSTCWSVRAWSRWGPAAGRSGPPSSRARPCRRRAREPGSFTLTNGSYRMAPAVDATARTLTIDVAFDAADRVRKPVRRVTRIRRAAFRALVSASRLVARRSKPRVLFTSRLISEMSGNLQVVNARMVERGLDREADLTVMLKPGLTERWSFLDRLRLARALAGADVIVLDDSFPPLDWVRLSPAVRIIQLWHASGAFKTVGFSRIGLPDPNVRGPPEVHRGDRQLGVRRAFLRRGIRHPRKARYPDRHPPDGPVLRREAQAEGLAPPGRRTRRSSGAGRSCSRPRTAATRSGRRRTRSSCSTTRRSTRWRSSATRRSSSRCTRSCSSRSASRRRSGTA